MLRGQVAVFLSCSEKFKPSVAWPIRDALAVHGLRTLIMSDEPPLLSVGGDAETKAEPYLDASSAFVALCTADHELSDGTKIPRANIIDEIQQAVSRPHLRDHAQILKSPGVLLPSDITPTYDSLDVTRPAAAAEVVLKQFQQWRIGPAPARPPAVPPPARAAGPADLGALLAGLRPGDDDEARRRIYPLLRDRAEDQRRSIARELHREVTESDDQARALAAAALLEAASGLDTVLVPNEMIEAMAAHPGYPARACAANLLRERAASAPFDVPVELLGRLATPGTEDWLVWASAMAATAELVRHRRAANVIFESLAASADSRDRFAVAVTLLGVAALEPVAVARSVAQQLAGDPDQLVAAKAREVMTAIEL
jgi:hypothetical protein